MNHSAVTLNVQISPSIRDQLVNLSVATHKTESFLAAEAIERYLAVQAWQTEAIKKSLRKANSKKAEFVSHDKVVTWLI